MRWKYYFPYMHAYVLNKSFECTTCTPQRAARMEVVGWADFLGVKPWEHNKNKGIGKQTQAKTKEKQANTSKSNQKH